MTMHFSLYDAIFIDIGVYFYYGTTLDLDQGLYLNIGFITYLRVSRILHWKRRVLLAP
jgi:hypothetical protein